MLRGNATTKSENELYAAYVRMSRKAPRKRGKALYRFAYELLECAKRDFVASSMLFHAKIYSLAIYHLQQAAEKADKSFLTYLGYLDEDDMREAGHNRLKTEKFIRPRLQAIAEEMEVIHPGSGDSSKDWMPLADTLPNLSDIARASRTWILLYVFGVDMDEMDKFYKESGSLRRAITKRGVKIESTVPFMREMLLSLQLTKIAMVATPHAWSTRYPTRSKKTLSPTDYTSKLGIVQASNELVISVGQAISTIDQIYRDEKKGPYSKYGSFRVTTHPGRKSKNALAFRIEYSPPVGKDGG